MTTKATMICAVATVWCAATAVKAALALIHREPYIQSWWDAGVVGGGRRFGRGRTAIKLVTMLGIAVAAALALAQVLESTQAIYAVLALGAVTAISEVSSPKPQRGKR
jgi:hypothetical protein